LLPLGIVVGVGLVMLAWTWGAWADVLVDFGRELYLPWQISQGQVLYRDLAFHNGPFSQYFNAAVFKLFGVSLLALVASNLVWMAVLIACVYWLFGRLGRWTAAAVCGVFLLLFGFAQYIPCGNYNYVCPYSHELTHGLTLLMLATLALWRLDRQPALAAAIGGVCLGVVFLTKVELFLPAMVSACAALALVLWSGRASRRGWLKAFGSFLAAAAAPPLASLALLSLAMPAPEALRGTLGSWMALHESRLRGLLFYRKVMGLDEPAKNLLSMLRWVGGYAAVLAPAVLASLAMRRPGPGRWVVAAIVAVATAGVLLGAGDRVDWLMAGKCWPALLAAMAAVQVWRLRKLPDSQRRPAALWLSLIVLAGAMSARMALNCRVWHYGFIYAMPAALVVTAWLLSDLPSQLDRHGGFGQAVRLTSSLVLVVAVSAHLMNLRSRLAAKTVWVGSGADALRADPVRGPVVAKALAALAGTAPPADTLLVAPEGVMLNYLSRRANPTPYVNFMPLEVILFGQDRILNALSQHPPDMIVMVPKSTAEYGFEGFGRDYAQDIARYLKANYAPLLRVAGRPSAEGTFSITLARRSQRPPAPAVDPSR
jgi:hypothetical protein